jgi:hypothetical protein
MQQPHYGAANSGGWQNLWQRIAAPNENSAVNPGLIAAKIYTRRSAYRLSVIPENCSPFSHGSCLFHGIAES